MGRLGETLQQMKDYWLLGLIVMLMLGATALGAAALALLLLVPFSLIFGWEGDAIETGLMISAVLWLPFVIGRAAVNLKHLLKLPRNADGRLRPGAARR